MVRKDDEDLRDLLEEKGKGKRNGSGGNALQYGAFVTLVVFGVFLFFLTFIVNTTKEYGKIAHDHSNIQSKYDLKIGSIDHWCLGGGNENCPCEDPLQPMARVDRPSWVQAYKANRKKVSKLAGQRVDVAILGESAIEEMGGRWMGHKQNRGSLHELEHHFETHFSTDHGSSIDGVALGIAGDTASQVLWRLLHGEMTEEFNPAVWWVSLGNNDLGRMKCSEEVVELGILRVVEEILDQKPNAHIVINSVLPMTDMRGGLYPLLNDYKDSFLKARKPLFHSRARDNDGRSLRWGETPTAATPEGAADDAYIQKQAQVEEEARDKKAHVERYYRKHMVSNPIMKDTETVHNLRLGTFRKTTKPIWTSIKAINAELMKFAEKHDRVTFFDCTPLFVKADMRQQDRSVLLTSYISMRGHPTEAGFILWEQKMKEMVISILDENGLHDSGDDFTEGVLDDMLQDSMLDDSFKDYGDGATIIGPGMVTPSNPVNPIEWEAQTTNANPGFGEKSVTSGLMPPQPPNYVPDSSIQQPPMVTGPYFPSSEGSAVGSYSRTEPRSGDNTLLQQPQLPSDSFPDSSSYSIQQPPIAAGPSFPGAEGSKAGSYSRTEPRSGENILLQQQQLPSDAFSASSVQPGFPSQTNGTEPPLQSGAHESVYGFQTSNRTAETRPTVVGDPVDPEIVDGHDGGDDGEAITDDAAM